MFRGCVAILLVLSSVSITFAQVAPSTRPTTRPTTGPTTRFTTRPASEAEDRESIRRSIEAFGKAIRDDDPAGIEYVDADRIVRDLFKHPAMKKMAMKDRFGFVAGMRLGFKQWFNKDSRFPAWLSARIVQFVPLNESEARVTAIVNGPNGEQLMWLWVSRRNDHWALFDFQDLNAGRRLNPVLAWTSVAGVGADPADRRIGQNVGRLQRLTDLLGAGESAKLLEEAADLTNEDMAPEFRPLLHAMRAGAMLKLQRFDDAAKTAAYARTLDPEFPYAYSLEAAARLGMREFDPALALADTYRKMVGLVPDIEATRTRALIGLKRNDEALTAVKQALASYPDSPHLLRALAKIAHPDARKVLQEQIRHITFDHASLRSLLTELDRDGSLDAVEDVLAQHGRLIEGTVDHRFFTAAVHSFHGRSEEAAELFKADLRTTDPHFARAVPTRFAQEMARSGRAVEAYRMTGKTVRVFDILGKEPKVTPREWDQITELHLEAHPEHVDAWWERGEVYLRQSRFNEAAVTLDAALQRASQLDEDSATHLDRRCTWAHYRAGSGLGFFGREPASKRRFAQLGNHMYDDRNAEQLQQLIDLHRRALPDSNYLILAEIDLASLGREHTKVFELIGRLPADRSKIWRVRDRAVRACLGLKAFDQATAFATADDGGDPLHHALIAGAKGDWAEADRVIRQAIADEEYLASEFLDDPDLGPLLQREELKDTLAFLKAPSTQPSVP